MPACMGRRRRATGEGQSAVSSLRIFDDLGTGFHIVFNRLMECVVQVGHRIGMKADAVTDVSNVTDKDLVRVIVFNAGGIASVGHCIGHGTTPIRYKWID